MKLHIVDNFMKLTCIIQILLTGAFVGLSSCTTNTSQSVTTHPDGSTTTVPVLSPKDAAFHEACQATLNCKF